MGECLVVVEEKLACFAPKNIRVFALEKRMPFAKTYITFTRTSDPPWCAFLSLLILPSHSLHKATDACCQEPSSPMAI